VVGGFYNKVARESSYAKLSLGTLPKASFPEPNRNLKVVKDFVEALRVSQHKAIYDCFRYYNAQGGKSVDAAVWRPSKVPTYIAL
jgi:hypothetical protein